ncbi:vesicular glutamate transporter 1-like isoform X2 [Ischnura elegans]|uniref:vesicular glutamate transporter 1-like isoform X2 n=1 Tax=Ischnura elegans TaxID=197161 RepID=UPI001ED89AE0|nr:vesicular glutamate transporter 1-like isoform X2 [Ischnura elegans]
MQLCANSSNHSSYLTAVEDSCEGMNHGNSNSQGWRFSIPRRYLVAFLAFLGFWNIYGLRVNLSVAIVAMTRNRTSNGNDTVVEPEFSWGPQEQGLALGSFFYGYALSQIPGGWMAGRMLGGRALFGFGVGATALLTLFTPLLARAGLPFIIALRVFEGLFEGVTYPAIHAVWARWAPPGERTHLATFAFSGSYFGTVASLSIASLLAESLGWPSIFYAFGVVGLLWFFIWMTFVKETPQEDRRITDFELDLIRSSVGPASNHGKDVHVPWRHFVTSLPVWAIAIAHFCENWGFYTLLTELPTYLTDVLGLDLKSVGFLSAMPYLLMGFVVQFGGLIADYLIFKKRFSKTQIRKICTCGAFVFQAVFLLLASKARSPPLVITLLTFAVGIGGFAWAGFSVNHLDLAPQYASILMGISNTMATLPGMISPSLTGYLVQHKSALEWEVVFYIAAGIYLTGALLYGLFATAERQHWAQSSDQQSLFYDGNGMEDGCAEDDDGGDNQSKTSTEDLPFGSGSCD